MNPTSPCVTVPAAEMGVGAQLICLLALLLLRALAWAAAHRKRGPQ
jgi:hypothetical protein